MEDENKLEAVQSIFRAAQILNSISSGVHSMTEIGLACQLSKSTTHRLLQALVNSNFVTQDPINRQYYLGYSITHLIARPEMTHEYLVTCARDEIKKLAEITGETVSFGLLLALRYVNLFSIPSRYNLRVMEEPEASGSIQAGAHRRVLLSQLNDKELKSVIKIIELLPLKEHVDETKSGLKEQIELIRRQGYAVSSNERTTGVTCIAAPVRNYGLPVTLYILAPESRISPRITELIDALLTSANRISDNIARLIPHGK